MKYKELIHFDPITSVIKLVDTEKYSNAENIVKTYVFSRKITEDIVAVILKNLILGEAEETKGIQVVGSYGTGKSHLMALIAAIAEDESLLNFLTDDGIKVLFKGIAGRYKVLRFEIGTDKALKDILFAQLERYMATIGVTYTFDEKSNFSWKEQLQEMMAAFEEIYSDKYFLVVIDELLEYLKGRNPTVLNNDLMLLRQLGEACDNSRFKLMFGVQELLYRSPEFQFAAEMLNKVEDRFEDITITREDVAYVVKERLLKKDNHQKQKIRDHLLNFAPFFEGINTHLNDYVDLYPVHPGYITNFEAIKHGKSQREILKTLSTRFESLMDQVVPGDQPGLITYDTYWEDISQNPSMLTIPDIRTVKDKIDIVYERISSHFVKGRSSKKALAIKIANALAIRILCDDLDKHNGANAHNLKEELCLMNPLADSANLLTEIIESTAGQLKSATSGQYIDRESLSDQFYIRTEGGINIPQIVKDYADTVLKRNIDEADQYFYDFLQYILEFTDEPYRSGFKIWQHRLNWLDKKSFRRGYIFFGNPGERSTTEPIQQYYIFFCPLFNNIVYNIDDHEIKNEIYFSMSSLSEKFKEIIRLFGAAKATEANASSAQKKLFRSQMEEHRNQAMELFEKEFTRSTRVYYDKKETLLNSYSLKGGGASKMMLFEDVAAKVLNKYFNDEYKDYPCFHDLPAPLTENNFERIIRSALKKIVAFSQPNKDGEAILSGLGLLQGPKLETHNSRYADAILKRLNDKGSGKVLNREDIIYAHYKAQNLWYSVDFKLDHELLFVVLAVMVYKGDIEIIWSGNRTLSATNIEQDLLKIPFEDFHTYHSIRKPLGLPIKAIKTLFHVLGLPDLSAELEQAETLSKIQIESSQRAERVVKFAAALEEGITCRNIPLLTESQIVDMGKKLETLRNLLDGIQKYNTFGKLKGFRYSKEELIESFHAWEYCDFIEELQNRAESFSKLIGYLYTAQSYMVESERPLYEDINKAISKLSLVLREDDKKELIKYETLLNSLKDQYADYYLAQYTKCRLSNTDSQEKNKILSSDIKRICDVIKEARFISKTEYENWVNKITALKKADPGLTKKKLLEEPYHDFNPREFYDKPAYNIQELEEELENILDKWINSMKSMFKDPSVKANLEVLDISQRNLVEGFREGKIELSTENAIQLRKLIGELSKEIDRIYITVEELEKVFSKPLKPEEAVEAFETYVEELCAGKERNKIRIIFK